MNYADAVRYLYALGNEIQTAKLGLDRISSLLSELGDPHRGGRFVHVAGTNGKGSTCAMIESGLRACGVRTGLYTSPHLIAPTERIQVNGIPVSQDAFAAAFNVVHEAAVRMLERGVLDLHPTYFETITAMAFLILRDSRVDTAVLEVGLGGRLDATNVIRPALSVITPIDLDHQQWLGHTIAKIAAEKAGILKPGIPAIFATQHLEALEVLRAYASGPVIEGADWPVSEVEIHSRGSRFRIGGMRVVCPLGGEHQIDNARTAALALRQLGYPPSGIAGAIWPGRLEHVPGVPEIILDGAHNEAGSRALGSYIREFYGRRPVWLIYGALRDKDVTAMTAHLFPLAERVIVTAPDNSRACPPEEIPAPGATVTLSIPEALALARRAPARTVIFVTGSLFVVGEARAALGLGNAASASAP